MSRTLDPKAVQKIASLSKLSSTPTDEFLEKYATEISSVLDYAEELKAIDTQGIDPLDGIRTIRIAQLREDEPATNQDDYQATRLSIIANFPNKQGNLLVVPGIFE